MPDITTHAAASNAVLAGTLYSSTYTSEMVTPAVAVAFLAGSLIPDIGNIGYFVLGKIRGRGLDILPTKWRGRIFRFVDHRSWWGMPYQFTHSLVGFMIMALLAYLIFGAPVALSYAAGHALHLTLDAPTHEDLWLLWPIAPMRVPVWNWWRMGVHRNHSYALHVIGIPINCTIAWLLVYGSPL